MGRNPYSFGPHELPCGADGSRLVIAYGERGDRFWDAVYYRARFAGDAIGERFAVTKPVLLDAIRVLFAEAGEPYDADTVVAYIGSTTWGSRLSRLTAKRAPHPTPQDEIAAAEHGWSSDRD